MKVYPNIFSNNPVNRVSDLRSDPSWVDKTLNNENSENESKLVLLEEMYLETENHYLTAYYLVFGKLWQDL